MHHVMSERAPCLKMAAVCGCRAPLASSADETSSLYMISMGKMAQSVVIGLLCTACVGNDTLIALVLYFECLIENINIYYLSYL